jgi:prevent-host-death family protein
MPARQKKKRYSIAEARDQLTRIVHEAEDGTTIELTRRAEPVAVMISLQEYQHFHQQKDEFWKKLDDFRKRLKAEDYLQPEDFEQLRDFTSGRNVEL